MGKNKKTNKFGYYWIASFVVSCGLTFLAQGTSLEAALYDRFEQTRKPVSQREMPGQVEQQRVLDPHFEFMGSNPLSVPGPAAADRGVSGKQSATQTLNEARGETSPGNERSVKESLVEAIAGSPLSRPGEVKGDVATISELDIHRLMHIAFQAKPPSIEQMFLVKSIGDRLLSGETIIIDDTNAVPDVTPTTVAAYYPYDITEALKFLVERRFDDLNYVVKQSDRQWQMLEFLKEMSDHHEAFRDLFDRYEDFLNGRVAPTSHMGMAAMPTF